MVYDNKVQGIRVLEKKLLLLFSKKNKDKQNKKTKASKRFSIPLCKQNNKMSII